MRKVTQKSNPMETDSAQKQPGRLRKVAECLYRNHNGTYIAIVKVHGKQIKRSLETEDAALAKRRLGELRMKAQGLAGDAKRTTFDQLAERWLSIKKPELRPRSHERLGDIIKVVTPYFKGLPVRSVGQNQIEQWKLRRSAKISARSFNYERDTLRAMFEYARGEMRIIIDNPFDVIKKRKLGRPNIVIPSKDQFRVLLDTLRKEPRAKEAPDFIEFLGYSGLRLGEAREVLWCDINFDLDSLLVTGGENGTKNHDVRTIPIFAPLRRLLLKMKADAPITPDARLFDLDTAKKALLTGCRKAGLPRFGHHAMRHFFCSNAIEAGCDFKVIAEWLGHKDGGVLVARTYGHLRNEHSSAMAKRITFDASAESV